MPSQEIGALFTAPFPLINATPFCTVAVSILITACTDDVSISITASATVATNIFFISFVPFCCWLSLFRLLFSPTINYPLLWSPTGKPVAPSGSPVGRNPEQEPSAKAGAQVEGCSRDNEQYRFRVTTLSKVSAQSR